MLDQMKQAKQMYALQKELKREMFEEEKSGVTVVINGVMEIEKITLNEDLSVSEQGKIVKDALNAAMHKARMAAAQKMQGLR